MIDLKRLRYLWDRDKSLINPLGIGEEAIQSEEFWEVWESLPELLDELERLYEREEESRQLGMELDLLD